MTRQSTGQVTHHCLGTRSPLVIIVLLNAFSAAQSSASPKKQILVIGEEKGYRHEAVSQQKMIIEAIRWSSGISDADLNSRPLPQGQ